MKQNSKYIFVLKITISILLIIWMLHTDKLNIENVKIGFSNLSLAIYFLILTFIQLVLGALRTQILMQFNKKTHINFRKIFSISWASSFINCIAPISVFGDFFRIKKLMDIESDLSKDNSIYASIFSKIFSIFALGLITVFAGIIVKPANENIKQFYICLVFFFILFILLFFLRFKIIQLLRPFLKRISDANKFRFIDSRIQNFKSYNRNLIHQKSIFFSSLLLSVLIQTLNTISLILIIKTINPMSHVSIYELAYLIPLGIFFMTLPISFSGLGVGHVAFSKLLNLYGISNGADVFTIFFAFSYIFNFIGIIPFFTVLREK